jgi:hypothetical protein
MKRLEEHEGVEESKRLVVKDSSDYQMRSFRNLNSEYGESKAKGLIE